MRAAAAAIVALLAGGCGDDGPRLVPDSPLQQQNVMVIDTGMDLSVPDLNRKVSGAYTEVCGSDVDDGPDIYADAGPPVDAGPTFDTLKQKLIAAYSQTDDSCHLNTGISAKSDPLAAIASYRDRWNAMILANQQETDGSPFSYDDWAKITGPIDNELFTFDYHGTATSTTVAHGYDDVRLILVERQLLSETEAQSTFSCFVQSETDQATLMLTDPDVFAAAVNQPATLDMDYAAAWTAHHVGVVNESFGYPSAVSLEILQRNANCPGPIDLSKYFQAVTAIDVARAAARAAPAVLTVRAAGNDGTRIDSSADEVDCNPGDPAALVVGSYDPATGGRNQFTNWGDCVDLYAPGQAIVTMYAGGWLLPVDGTSFASPLTARFASMNAPSPFDVGTTRQAVLASLDQYDNLPADSFPSYFYYAPGEIYTEALIAAPVRPPPPPRKLTAIDFHRVMAPLRLLRRLRKS
ncbi:MAG TPA: S8 family serine peptidase [Polyangia bacterium]|nr:S8 family serine peptidase [Polyangia bacterium]